MEHSCCTASACKAPLAVFNAPISMDEAELNRDSMNQQRLLSIGQASRDAAPQGPEAVSDTHTNMDQAELNRVFMNQQWMLSMGEPRDPMDVFKAPIDMDQAELNRKVMSRRLQRYVKKASPDTASREIQAAVSDVPIDEDMDQAKLNRRLVNQRWLRYADQASWDAKQRDPMDVFDEPIGTDEPYTELEVLKKRSPLIARSTPKSAVVVFEDMDYLVPQQEGMGCFLLQREDPAEEKPLSDGPQNGEEREGPRSMGQRMQGS